MRKLLSADAKDRYEQQETWCAVARMKEEEWCRRQRQHFRHHLESHLFEDEVTQSQPRCTFRVDAPAHLQRRHFAPKHLISKWTAM